MPGAADKISIAQNTASAMQANGFQGLYGADVSASEARVVNAAALERAKQFKNEFAALAPSPPADKAGKGFADPAEYESAYAGKVRAFVGGFEPARLARLNTSELMTVYTKLRDLGDFEGMKKLYENAGDKNFKNAPMVREYLAVACNRTGEPTKAVAIADGLIRDGQGSGEVFGIRGKSLERRGDAAESLAQAYEGGNRGTIGRSQEYYRQVFGADAKDVPGDAAAARQQAEKEFGSARETYHAGFSKTYESYPGINAAYADLSAGDFKAAQRTAEITYDVSLRDGGLITNDFYQTQTMLQAQILKGDGPEAVNKTLAKLVSYENISETQWGTLGDALDGRLRPGLERAAAGGDAESAQAAQSLKVLDSVKDTLRQRYADPKYRMTADAIEPRDLALEKSFSYRGMSTWDAQRSIGNARYGGAVADHIVTNRDRQEFEKILNHPVDDVMRMIGGNPADLPASVHGKTLSQIEDPTVFIETTQKLTRANFSTDARQLEIIDGATHKETFDNKVEALNHLAGLPDDKDIRKTYDTSTSLTAEFVKGLGDCRHHAQTQQLLFDEWQKNRYDAALREKENAATPEARAAAQAKLDDIRNTQLRTFDIEINAPIKVDGTYHPTRPGEGVGGRPAGESFIASDKVNFIEEHTLNILVKTDNAGKVTSMRFADAFYENTYKWRNGEIDLSKLRIETDDKGVQRLIIPGGKLEGVAGAPGNAVDVTIRTTSYSGTRREQVAGYTGGISERGAEVLDFDVMEQLKQRAAINEKIAQAQELLNQQEKPAAETVARKEEAKPAEETRRTQAETVRAKPEEPVRKRAETVRTKPEEPAREPAVKPATEREKTAVGLGPVREESKPTVIERINEKGGRGIGVGMSGFQVAQSIQSGIDHVKDIREGKTTQGSAGLTLDAANATTGGINLVQIVAPKAAGRLLSEGVVGLAEKSAVPLMFAMGIFNIATASPEERSLVAGREAVSTGVGLAVMAVAGTSAAGIALSVVAPIAAGWAYEKEMKMDTLIIEHEKHMADISFSYSGKHIESVAANMQQTLQMAHFGDMMAKDKDGKVDINSRQNLDRIKAVLPPADAKQLAAMPTDQQQRALQGIAFNLQKAVDDRDKAVGKAAEFKLDDKGKIDLADRGNQEMIRKLAALQQDGITKAREAVDQISTLPGFAMKEDKLRASIGLEESQKTLSVALGELNSIRVERRYKFETGIKAPEQIEQDVQSVLSGKRPAVEVATFMYTVRDGRLVTDDRNPPVPDNVLRAYKADPLRNSLVDQMIYKYDGTGNLVPDKLVQYKIYDSNPEIAKQQRSSIAGVVAPEAGIPKNAPERIKAVNATHISVTGAVDQVELQPSAVTGKLDLPPEAPRDMATEEHPLGWEEQQENKTAAPTVAQPEAASSAAAAPAQPSPFADQPQFNGFALATAQDNMVGNAEGAAMARDAAERQIRELEESRGGGDMVVASAKPGAGGPVQGQPDAAPNVYGADPNADSSTLASAAATQNPQPRKNAAPGGA